MPSIETRYGQLELPDMEADLIGRFLARYGEWAWDEVCFVASTLTTGARVLDVGAYLGTFGLGIGLRQNVGSICYVEANPLIADYLRENVRRLKRQPSQVVSALVHPGETPPTRAHIDPGNYGSLSFASDASGEIADVSPTSFTTLAELRDLYGPFDLIKLDVEGMELDLLQADAEFLRSTACHFWLECNETHRSLELVELLLSSGLDVYYFAFPSYNPNNLRNDPDPIYPFAYEAGLLAGRNLKPELDKALAEHDCVLQAIRTPDELRDALWRTPRWGKPEWQERASHEIAALAGRELLGQDYAHFLSEDASAPSPYMTATFVARLEARLEKYEQELSDSRKAYDQLKNEAAAQRREAESATRALEQQALREREKHEVTEAARRQLEADTAIMAGLIHEQDGRFRELEGQFTEVSTVANERLFQLSKMEPRLGQAETAMANAQVRMMQAMRELGAERERARRIEADLRDRLRATDMDTDAHDLDHLQSRDALRHAQARLADLEQEKLQLANELAAWRSEAGNLSEIARKRRRKRWKLGINIKKTRWYQRSFRPRMQSLRRFMKKAPE